MITKKNIWSNTFWFLLFGFVSSLIYLVYSKNVIFTLSFIVLFVIVSNFVSKPKTIILIVLITIIFLVLAFIHQLLGIEKFQIKDLFKYIPDEFNIRTLILNQIKNNKNETVSNLMLLIVFNEKSNSIKDFYEQLINLGVVHLVVVSGLHLNFINSLIVKLFFKNFKLGQSISLFVIFVYSFLLNFSFGIIRVFLTILIEFFISKHQNSNSSLMSTSLSGLITLLISPYAIFNLSFQLSYLAIFGIYFANKIPYINKWVVGILTSFIINLLLGPIILKLNKKINLLTIFNSWILSPIVIFYYLLSLFIFWFPWTWNIFDPIYSFLFLVIDLLHEIKLFIYLDIRDINSWLIYIYYQLFFTSLTFLHKNNNLVDKKVKYINKFVY